MMCGWLLQPDSEGEFIYTLSVQHFWDVCGAPSCSVCHWDLFLLEVFRTWTSRGWSPLLPAEGGAGQFPGPHPTTLWLLCPSRLRPSWLLAGCLDCWELMCPQHSLEMHIQFSRPPELGGLAGYGFGPCQAESNPCSHLRRRWPVDLPAWDDMLVPALCFSTQLSFQNTDRSLSRAIEDRQRSAPSAQHIQRSFCLHPSLVSCVSPATLDDLKVPPDALCVFELCDGCSFHGVAALCPLPFTPLAILPNSAGTVPSRPEALWSKHPSLTPPLPASPPQEWLCRARCCVCMFPVCCQLPRPHLCSGQSSKGSGACFFAFFLLLFLSLSLPGGFHNI